MNNEEQGLLPMNDLMSRSGIEELEKEMLNMEQVECPVVHKFAPGLYIREVHLPKGAFVVGHFQKTEHYNVMLTGKVLMLTSDEQVVEVQAPMSVVGQPSRKIGYIVEDVIWQNIYATTETDVDKLEKLFIDKSVVFGEHEVLARKFNNTFIQQDRDDYEKLLSDYGLSQDQVKQVVVNPLDQIEFDDYFSNIITVRESNIHGKGCFLSIPVKEGQFIAPARIGGYRTPVGRYTNHSINPNCEFVKLDNDDIVLVAKQDLRGCTGGSKGDELTVNYRQALTLSGIYLEDSSCPV